MTTPISSDKTLAASQEQAFRTQSRGNPPSRSEATPTAVQAPNNPAINAVDVERASSLYNQDSAVKAPGASIENASQARSMAADLKAQMSANPAAALGVFGNPTAQQASAVLAQATA
jgi:hypothetical protein